MAPLVELIFQRNAGKSALEDALAQAQSLLLKQICASTNEIYWMQSYFEPVGSRDAYGVISRAFEDLFFYKAIDLAAPGGTAEAFYRDRIIQPLNAMTKEERERHSLSVRFTTPTTPSLVALSFRENAIESDWSEIGNVHSLYNALFEGERASYKYIHVACPLRNTKIGSLLGPAGIYFLTAGRGLDGQRPCFVWHLQMFLQAIVTAQLWATSEHRKATVEAEHSRLERATRLLRKNFGVMREMADESRTLATMVDPFKITTEVLDKAQRSALRLFRTEVSDADITESSERGGILSIDQGPLHTVRQWLAAPSWYAEKHLKQFKESLVRYIDDSDPLLDPSVRVVRAIHDAVNAALDNQRFEVAFRHAKALAHNSVVGSLVDTTSSCTDSIQPSSTVDSARDLEGLYLRQAIVRLYSGIADGIFTVRLGSDSLDLQYEADAEDLHQRAVAILDMGRVGVGERDGATNLVGILRGLMGGGDLHELREVDAGKARKIANGASSCIGVKVNIACRFRREQ